VLSVGGYATGVASATGSWIAVGAGVSAGYALDAVGGCAMAAAGGAHTATTTKHEIERLPSIWVLENPNNMGSRAAPRKRTSPAPLAFRRRTWARAGLLALLGAVGAVGCDVVQGFEHAGDALFPTVKTYLDAPGYRLAAGGYRQLVLLTSSELYVLARGTRSDDASLYSIRYSLPAPCSIPEVGRYWAGGSLDVGQAWIAFFHGGGSRGTLSFSDTSCHVSSLTLPEAELPYARVTPRNANGELEPDRLELLIHSGKQLLLVDPAAAKPPEVLIDPADAVLAGFGKANLGLVLSDGKLAAFDSEWRYLQTFADGVVAVAQLGDSVYFEDSGGIQRATASARGTEPAVETTVIADDGCGLAFPSTSRHWVGFFSPCADRTLALYNESTKEVTRPELIVDDPRALLLSPKPGLTGTPKPELDSVWAYFLRDINYQAGVGTLVARAPDGTELVLGSNAALERTVLDKGGAYGYALVDVSGDTGTSVRWRPDGSVVELAQQVLREGTDEGWADLLVDWDGTSGTLAQLNGGELYRLLEHVPRHGYAYEDVHGRRALFNDFDGENGTLSIGEAACSPGTTHCEREYYVPHVVARGVHHPGHAFLDQEADFLPGIGFLDQYDVTSGTGRFQYRNLELGFTSIVSEGVSDFVFAGSGMLYAVPYGEGAGIWLARAK